ncbi:hypothetical protein NM74_11105 [Aeromonas hydrophila]|uniref:hypothetical protein n=1 Tax=Aeromonas hydrophila TaxID=644 RepID=UPI0005388255|nr:hypothetical protein [Aeromonas hydrophila]KHA56559.1 hypothetical protein NM74_11105 [Aeromonas hydrophila]
MLPSFGISKKIVENPFYNLGVALPFLCAFYLVNIDAPVIVPIFGYELGREVSSIFRIVMVGFLYFMVVVYCTMASHFSFFAADSRLYWMLPVFICISSVVLIFGDADQPKLGVVFGVHSGLIMLFHWVGNGNKERISLIVTQLLGAVLSVSCFTAGNLWYFGDYLFVEQVGAVLGIGIPTTESLKLGALMMFTLGYVIFYGVFQVSRMIEFDPATS